MSESDVTHFIYDENDFIFNVPVKNEISKFDLLFKENWNKIEQDNVLRYSVKSQVFRILEGKYGFYAQLNTERATLRRKPEEIKSMRQPFDLDRFNFTKISHKEMLIDIGDGQSNDIIAVNVSPIAEIHGLLLSQRLKCLPQNVTLNSLQKALEILLLSKSVNMRIVFNSLCANASVNHLHWHIYYLDQRMLLEWIPLKDFIDSVYVLENYPAKGFCIKLSSFRDHNIRNYISYVYKVVTCLQGNEIAHNIYITRSKSSVEKKEYDDIRIYIWARIPSYIYKKTEYLTIAACELFGHLIVKTKEGYEQINENYISKCLEDVTYDAFTIAQQKIAEVLNISKENSNTVT